MKKVGLSPVIEDYLKTVFHLLKEKGKANTNDLAKTLGVSPPTITQMIKKLAELRLVKHVPYKGFVLSTAGEKIAIEIIRHHRLVEQYLHEALGVPWDKVHEEAEKWEHFISEDVERRMDEVLNHPTRDPHGSPIPSEELVIENEELVLMSELDVGGKGVVREVPDEDPELLNYLEGMRLTPNTMFEVKRREPYGGPIVVSVDGQTFTVGLEAASQIRVKQVVGG
ncbi:MAG: metal-dependent transcriptional regulator [Candidatus Dadabacteria bacterium]|nr:metal-dependent transcriptional regulator [Candidatus Dadabacteria bacterium]